MSKLNRFEATVETLRGNRGLPATHEFDSFKTLGDLLRGRLCLPASTRFRAKRLAEGWEVLLGGRPVGRVYPVES